MEGALGGGVSFRAARLSAPLGEPIELVLARVRADGETAFHHIVREEARHAAAGTTVFCVTAQLREELFAVIQQLRKQHIPVGFMLVYSSTALSWPQQYLKERLEAIGCSVYTIKHAELEWHGHEVMHDVG